MSERIRNTRYLLSDLQSGDRFYFVGDRAKKVYTLNDMHPFEKKVQKGFHITYANCRIDTPGDGSRVIEQHKANRFVIFLRNINS